MAVLRPSSRRPAHLSKRERVAAAVLAVLAAGFIVLDLGGGSLEAAHGGARGLLGALYRGTDSVIGPVRRWVQGLPSAGSDESRVADLEQQNAVLRGALAEAQMDEKTAEQLQELSLTAGFTGQVVPTRVIAVGAGQGFDWTVTIGTGTSDGIAAGQSVTDGSGLVGRVLSADSSTAVVLLAADPGSGVGARDLTNGELGVATGAGVHGFTFAPLDPAVKLKVGDELVTGPGSESSFVAGLSIGTIGEVRTSTDGTVVATVRPTSPPSSLDLLGVLVSGTSGPDSTPRTESTGGTGGQ